ncbi:MAG: MFS transporter [Alphaproteobacteria bacterium]
MKDGNGPSVFLICVVITGLVALAPMSTDIAIPALPAIGRALEATPGQVGMIISLFALGVGLMQLVYGPLSDRYGRRRVLMGALVIYVLTTIGIVLVPTIESLIVLRFFQAIGACAGTVLGRAVVRDMFDRDRAGQVLGYVMTAMTVLCLAIPARDAGGIQSAAHRAPPDPAPFRSHAAPSRLSGIHLRHLWRLHCPLWLHRRGFLCLY